MCITEILASNDLIMRSVLYHVLLLVIFTADTILVASKNDEVILSRRKRYLVFPEGASMSIALCMTAQTILPAEVFTEGLNWGISYDLPNDTSAFRRQFHPKHVMQRRHRRDLYQKMELIMDSMGFDGRACIFKALCEASQKFLPEGSNLVEEILRIVFRFPQQKIMKIEPEEHRLYHWASRIGQEQRVDCLSMFQSCPFSLIDMALGRYSEDEENNDGN